MGKLTGRPVTLVLALLSAIVWSAGNRNRNKKLVYAGVALSVIAVVTFFLGV